LVEYFGGNFENVINQCNNCAKNFIDIILRYFPSYNDRSIYKEREVYFYKRVQILVADIWACFEGTSYGNFLDIHIVTMFADYRVPQALAFFGILKYSSHLINVLNSNTIIPPGDPLEIEIRGCSILAVELIKKQLITVIETALVNNEIDKNDLKNQKINSILIDFFLWIYAKTHKEELNLTPIHKTHTIFY